MDKKLVLNYKKIRGLVLRDHEIESTLLEFIEWLKLDAGDEKRQDYHPADSFGGYAKNLLNPQDDWKGYIDSDEWLVNVSQELIIRTALVLLREGKMPGIMLIIQYEGENIRIDSRGHFKDARDVPDEMRINFILLKRLIGF